MGLHRAHGRGGPGQGDPVRHPQRQPGNGPTGNPFVRFDEHAFDEGGGQSPVEERVLAVFPSQLARAV